MPTPSTRPVSSLLMCIAAGALSSCIFFVDEAAQGPGGGGAGGLGASSVSSGGAGAQGGTGGEGGAGGQGGGAPPECTAVLELDGFTNRGAVDQIVLSPPVAGVDVFVESSLDYVEALKSGALAQPIAATSLSALTGMRLAPHPQGGVIVAKNDVSWMTYTNASTLQSQQIWTGGVDRDVVAAVRSSSILYGLDANGRVLELTPNTGPAPVLSSGTVTNLIAYPSGVVWGTSNGQVVRCEGTGCPTPPTSTIPGGGALVAIEYAHPLRQYAALVDVGPELAVYTGLLVDGAEVDSATPLASLPFTGVVDIALAGTHLIVLRPDRMYPCCMESLLGDVPCGEPVPIDSGDLVAARDGVAVVQSRGAGIRLTAYRVLDAPR